MKKAFYLTVFALAISLSTSFRVTKNDKMLAQTHATYDEAAVTSTARMDTMDAKEREKDSHRTESERMEAERQRAKKRQKDRAKAEKFKNATEEEAFKPINGTVRDVQTKVAK